MSLHKTRYKANKQKEYDRDTYTREWLEYTENVSIRTIEECIEIVESLRDDYNTYHERIALKNAIRHLKMYLER